MDFDRAAALAYVRANTTHHVRAVIADLIEAARIERYDDDVEATLRVLAKEFRECKE